MTIRLLGIYIDLADAESLAGARVVLVEQRGNGPVVMRAANSGESPVVAALSRVGCEELAQIMTSLYASQRDQMAS